jgi:hypothetical protein
MIQHLYVNGCSFVRDNTIPLHEHFVNHIAHRYGWSHTNAGWPGSCNRRIIRNTLKHSLEFDSSTQVVVGLSALERTEINVYDNWDPDDPRMPGEDWFQGIKIDNTGSQFRDYREAWVRNYNIYGEAVNLATDVLALTAHLRVRNISYLIYPHRDLFYGHDRSVISVLGSHAVFRALSQDPKVINLLYDNLYQRLSPGNWSYDTFPQGHLNQAGHVHAADVIADLINSTNQGN